MRHRNVCRPIYSPHAAPRRQSTSALTCREWRASKNGVGAEASRSQPSSAIMARLKNKPKQRPSASIVITAAAGFCASARAPARPYCRLAQHSCVAISAHFHQVARCARLIVGAGAHALSKADAVRPASYVKRDSCRHSPRRLLPRRPEEIISRRQQYQPATGAAAMSPCRQSAAAPE